MPARKYQFPVPHQQDVPNDRQRKAYRDINEQFKQIAEDVGDLSTKVSTLSPTTAMPASIVQQLPSAQPVQQPSGGVTDATTLAIFDLETHGIADSPYAIAAGLNTFLMASASAGADFVAVLPAATGSGNLVVIKKMDANAHNIAITPTGADTIDGVNAAVNITLQYDALRLIDAGVGVWLIW
jgi:hypothetical protein